MRRWLPHLLMLMAIIAVAFISLASGSIHLSFTQVLDALIGDGNSTAQMVVTELRLPRVIAAITVGGLLALAGALMQILLHNPLADPYVLGVSGGAATATLGTIILGMPILADGAALAGAMLSVILVFILSRGRGEWSPTRLLLTGVVIAAGWGASINLLLAIAPEAPLRGMLFWLMGDLAGATMPRWSLLLLIGVTLVLLPLGRSLDLIARGDLQAAALGVDVKPLRVTLYLTTSLLTAAAVSIAGSVGFVGLVVPHLIRLFGMHDHRRLLPASVLAGALLLLCADTLSRTLIAPKQLPVGVLTALIGVPVFLYLLRRQSMGNRR